MGSLTDALMGRVETTSSLIERVDKLLGAEEAPRKWGNPRLSVTPTSLAIGELTAQVAALQEAVREVALEVQKLAASNP